MKYSQAQLTAAIAVLTAVSLPGYVSAKVSASEAQIQELINTGVITFDPKSQKPVLNLELLQKLKAEGRFKTRRTKLAVACTGVGGG